MKNLRGIVKSSLIVGLFYSGFEGINLYLTFPLYSLPGAIEAAIKNVVVFAGIGTGAYLFFSIPGRWLVRDTSTVSRLSLSSLLTFPVYFFLFTNFKETGLTYHYLSSETAIALVSAIPTLMLLFSFSKAMTGAHKDRCAGLAAVTFFFINLGYRYVEWGFLVKGRLTSLFSFLLLLVLTIAIYFIAIKMWESILRGIDRFRQRTRLWKLLCGVIGLCLLVIFRGTFYNSAPELNRSMGGHPNILLIVLDTARSDRFSCYEHPRDTTPFLKSFSEDATLYRAAITPSPWTPPSHASIFTGLYPSAHGLEWNGFSLDERYLTLPEYLVSRGYVTIGFCNNLLVTKESGLAQGFDDYFEMWDEDVLNPTLYYKLDWFLKKLLERNDGGALRTNQWVMEWLERSYQGERPYFLFINLMECHLKWDAPDAYHRRFLREDYSLKALEIDEDTYTFFTGIDTMTEVEWRDYQDIYDGDLLYLDHRLEELFSFLEDKSYLENTVVIITSDHGEFLGEHLLTGHTLSLYEPVLNVPLIIKVPDDLPDLPEVRGPVQTVDIYPTLVELLGEDLEDIGYPIQGVSLVKYGESPHDFTIAEFEPLKEKISSFLKAYPEATDIFLKFDTSLKMIRVDSLKYIWSSRNESELYDLSVDPGELQNLVDEYPEKSRELEEKLFDWLNSFEHSLATKEKKGLDPETRKRLKALGYID